MMASADDGSPPVREVPMPPGRQSAFGTTGDFVAPLGSRVDPDDPTGYYIDLRAKADSPDFSADLVAEMPSEPRVVVAQWALGCWEHYLAGDGEQWLAAARWAADRLLEQQHSSRALRRRLDPRLPLQAHLQDRSALDVGHGAGPGREPADSDPS